ncbi:MAG: SLC13 family permease [Desulforegulaceae bacterium]|nr:SLC13 family permease [Desulforegulaceae bacterium]
MALIVFIGGWLSADLVGLLVLSTLTLLGFLTPDEALAGFSSPAVVTVWAMFILSAGLNRTGIAHRLGQPLQRFAKGSEMTLVVVLMATASIFSALINTTTVAAVLLPTVMDLARRSGRPPSRLLMPFSLGCLLGGPFTGISTSTNILATDVLSSAGFTTFKIFDFTPITAAIVMAGILFVALIGRFLLPSGSGKTLENKNLSSEDPYGLDKHLFTTLIRPGSKLAGRTLVESRCGSALSITIVALKRKGVLILAPRPTEILQVGDKLIFHGQTDRVKQMNGSEHLKIEPMDQASNIICQQMVVADCRVSEDSSLLGATLFESGLRREHHVHVLTLHNSEGKLVKDALRHPFAPGDRLLLQGEKKALEEFFNKDLVTGPKFIDQSEVDNLTGGHGQILPVRIPSGSGLLDRSLLETRLGNVFGLTVAGILRDEALICMPSPQEKIQANDLLLMQGSPQDLEILEGLQDLVIYEKSAGLLAELESQQVGVTEVLLSPRTTLAGQTLGDLLFREHYGVSVLAILRKGKVFRTRLQEMPLKFGDALLVYGQREKLHAVARDPDFLVLDTSAVKVPRLEKAGFAAVIMVLVIASAILGLLPISIAAVAGASLMILSGALSMQEAYRAIEWRVVFLMASMLPLGVAIQKTGAAQMGADFLITMVGDLGPRWVVAAFFFVTVIAVQAIPPSALVVLMAPVALSVAASLGISPQLLIMTVAIAVSASFASPVSHAAHMLVMGPGGYKFIDYIKVGAPLTIIVFGVSVWLLPIFWPPY